jgi:hypothetical protein
MDSSELDVLSNLFAALSRQAPRERIAKQPVGAIAFPRPIYGRPAGGVGNVSD